MKNKIQQGALDDLPSSQGNLHVVRRKSSLIFQDYDYDYQIRASGLVAKYEKIHQT